MSRHNAVVTRRITGVVVLAALFALAACASSGSDNPDDGHGDADCAAQIRVDEAIYTSHGYTEQEATKHSVADRAECDDVGPDAAGSVFPGDPEQVTTWTFDGYPAGRVLGVRFNHTTFAVFVSDSVPQKEAERIYRELRKAGE